MLRRAKAEALDLPPKTRTWQPVEVDGEAVPAAGGAGARRSTRRIPSAVGPTWVDVPRPAQPGAPRARRGQGRRTRSRRCASGSRPARRSSSSRRSPSVDREAEGGARRRRRLDHGDDVAEAARAAAEAAFQNDDRVRVLLGNLHAAGVGINLTAGTHVVFNDLDWVPGNHWQAEDRIYRIGQTRPAFVTYLVAEGTLDDFVAALLEQKARTIGVLEDEAADRATLLDQAIEAALRGERPAPPAPRREPGEASVGLLGDVLDLLAQASRGLGAARARGARDHRHVEQRPGKTYEVRLSGGVATCTCPGFDYRGNCSHSRKVVADSAGAA